MTERDRTRTAAALLAVGALTWLPARWGVMTTWDVPWLGLDYAAWNRLTLIPLALLTLGAATAFRPTTRRSVSIGWAVVAVGFGLSWAGVALEFGVGGGLQGGPRGIAVAGWTAYLLGMAVTAGGFLVLAAALARRDAVAAVAAGSVAVAFLAWPLLLAVGQDALAVADHLVVAVPWLVLVARLQRSPAREPVPAPSV